MPNVHFFRVTCMTSVDREVPPLLTRDLRHMWRSACIQAWPICTRYPEASCVQKGDACDGGGAPGGGGGGGMLSQVKVKPVLPPPLQ